MADHVRKRIRDAAKTLLTGLATTGANVFASRVSPLQDDELPGLVITTPSEKDEAVTIHAPAQLERRLALVVSIRVKAADGYEDTVDQIAKEVEVRFASNPTLGGLCEHVWAQGITTELSEDGELDVAIGTMTFEAPYCTAENAPDTPL